MGVAMSTSSKPNPRPTPLSTSAFIRGCPPAASNRPRVREAPAEPRVGALPVRGWPVSRSGGPRLVVAAVHARRIRFKLIYPYVQDIFTIGPIAIKYRYGVAAPEIFRGGRRGAALPACVAQTARGPT